MRRRTFIETLALVGPIDDVNQVWQQWTQRSAHRRRGGRQHVRVGVLEPGAVATELESHNSDRVKAEIFVPFNEQTQKLEAEDIADGIAFMVTQPRHSSIAELWMMPTEQA